MSDTSGLDLGSNPKALLITWFVILVIGQIGVAVVIAVLLSFDDLKSRHLALLNLLVITFFSAFVDSIL